MKFLDGDVIVAMGADCVHFAPSVHAAYMFSIVVTLWPCCLATQSRFFPIIKFQLTEECRAQYGSR